MFNENPSALSVDGFLYIAENSQFASNKWHMGDEKIGR